MWGRTLLLLPKLLSQACMSGTNGPAGGGNPVFKLGSADGGSGYGNVGVEPRNKPPFITAAPNGGTLDRTLSGKSYSEDSSTLSPNLNLSHGTLLPDQSLIDWLTSGNATVSASETFGNYSTPLWNNSAESDESTTSVTLGNDSSRPPPSNNGASPTPVAVESASFGLWGIIILLLFLFLIFLGILVGGLWKKQRQESATVSISPAESSEPAGMYDAESQDIPASPLPVSSATPPPQPVQDSDAEEWPSRDILSRHHSAPQSEESYSWRPY